MNPTDTALEPGACILKDTIAEMTYPEIEASIARGAVALWGLGVIEQHGPHLPTGTDIYVPTMRLRLARMYLAKQGIETLIVPVFYWGVNHVSASFPASYQVRPEIMVELMSDVIGSLGQDGIKHVFCISGHGDARHNQTIFDGTVQASKTHGVSAIFAAPGSLFRRLGIDSEHPNALSTSPENGAAPSNASYIDVHAGNEETSLMMAIQPDLVRTPLIEGLSSTAGRSLHDLAKWRQGHDAARAVTPDGYFGDPASATLEYGVMTIRTEARDIATAIAESLSNQSTSNITARHHLNHKRC